MPSCTIAGVVRSLRTSRSDRVPQRAEFPSTLLSACAGESVEWIRQLDIDQTRTGDHRLPPCTRQGPRDSTRPEIDIAESVLRHWTLKADIRQRHPAAWLQHAEDLPVDADLVRAEVDHPIGDDGVRPSILYR